MHYRIFFYYFKCIILSCQIFKSAKALVGYGIRSAYPYEYPAVVLLSREDPLDQLVDNSLCTGTLISRTHILTAEHCFTELAIGNYKLQLSVASSDLSQSVYYDTVWWISYDQWIATFNRQPQTQYNDIAVLKILGGSAEVKPAVLSEITPQSLLFGMDVQVYGAGKSNNTQNPMAVHTAQIKIIPNRDCEQLAQAIAQCPILIPQNIICTYQNPYLQMGDGDSGGPLVFSNILVAVNAGVSPPTNNVFHSGKVNVHVGVDYYKNFIYSMLNIN